MLPRKDFENLRALVAILVIFKKFSGKFCIKFLTLLLSTSPNMMHFSHIFDYACLRRKAYLNRRGSRLWKNSIHQKHF